MQTYRLKIAQRDFEELGNLVLKDWPKEAGAFALAGVASHACGNDILIRRPVPIPRPHFLVQERYRLKISTQAVNGLIALCERNGLGVVLCHSHPEDIPYSRSDDHGERRIFETLREFIPQNAPTASLVFYPGGVRGRVWHPESMKPVPISEIVVIGRQVRRIQLDDGAASNDESVNAIFDRQVQAFGKQGQAMIARTKVGIIGVGGTGSPTAEQLIRLGVTDLVLIDPDVFEPSNITRVYGTFAAHLRRPWWRFWKIQPTKVELVAAHLRMINPRARINAVARSVILRDAIGKLLDRDILFLCTDNHWSRAIVNQVTHQYLVPTLNLGVRIDAKSGAITGAMGTVDVLRPDMPCPWCSQFLSAEQIAAESMPRASRQSLQREGYVQDIEIGEPSVVSMTTTVSGLAVTLFLQLCTDFMGSAGAIARLNYYIMDGTVRRGKATITSECVCKKVRGFGDLKLMPGLNGLPFSER